MIKVTAKSTGKNTIKIMTEINGMDETLIAEISALHKHLLETERGTSILFSALDNIQKYINEVTNE